MTGKKPPAFFIFSIATIIAAVAIVTVPTSRAESDSLQTVHEQFALDPNFSYLMMDHNNNLRKVDLLLDRRSHEQFAGPKIMMGASIIALLDYQQSNRENKFSYLMRHPTASNQVGKEVSEATLHSFQLCFTGEINSWMTLFAEFLYDPQQSFGAGTITSLDRNQVQLRKGAVVFGDLQKSPVYAAIGKMDVPFGQTGSVSPFTNSTMWHAFGALGYAFRVGVRQSDFHLTATAVQGGSQFRALNTPTGDGTNVPSELNNYTADLSYFYRLSQKLDGQLGVSYLRGSAYCQDFPVTHFEPCKECNPAYSLYGNLHGGENLLFMASFAKTTKVWPGTFNPTPPLDRFAASKVSSLDLGIRYLVKGKGNVDYALSAEFSNFNAGPKGAPWEKQDQIVLGIAGIFKNSSRIFLELFRTTGYAPLNFISGSNDFDPFPPGETHSDQSAEGVGIVLGTQVVI